MRSPRQFQAGGRLSTASAGVALSTPDRQHHRRKGHRPEAGLQSGGSRGPGTAPLGARLRALWRRVGARRRTAGAGVTVVAAGLAGRRVAGAAAVARGRVATGARVARATVVARAG